MTLSTNPPRGTADRYPEEYRVRSYIFDTWRAVCTSFGYKEYLGPLVEDSAIWKAKSGEDVGGTELTLLTDREGNVGDLALRPEMTPTVTRMVTKKRNELPKPVRWFSIANFYRNERPQRGRNREFRQCNVDLFGETSLQADVEVLSMAIELMKAFGANEEKFEVRINNRALVDTFLSQFISDTTPLVRLLDKWTKLQPEVMTSALAELGLDQKGIDAVVAFMGTPSVQAFEEVFANLIDDPSVQELRLLMKYLEKLGYEPYIRFCPSLMRGFDYYDGMVFEVFDLHPDNKRALFGGGRYNGLAEIFGAKEAIPAVGFAPGDETMKLFLESRDLLPVDTGNDTYYVPLLDESVLTKQQTIAQEFRKQGNKVVTGLKTQKLGKAFQYAEKNMYSFVVIVREDTVKIKNISSGEEVLFEHE